jgi:hypothetical protein
MLLLSFTILLIINCILLIILTSRNGAYNLDGTYSEANSSQLIFTAIMGFIFSIPLLCAIISVVIANFLNKRTSFKQRFVRTFLNVIVVLYAITFIRFFIIVVTS